MATTVSSLDLERERLRREGWSDAEIQNILMQREILGTASSSMQPVGASVQGPMTGVLGNASAVLSHARGTIPAIKADAANLLNSRAPRVSRTKSAAGLLCVAVLVAVLGFAIYQEWMQHIVYGTETARQQAQLTEQQAILARDQRGTTMVEVIALKKRKADEVRAALDAGRYADGYRIAHMYFGNDMMGESSVILSWAALLDRKYPEALAAVESSSADDLPAELNRSHALMLLGRTAEAKAAYLAHKDETINGKAWGQVVLEDFAELRKAGITNPMMAEIGTVLMAAP